MAELSAADINNLPDDAFAYIESGGTKDSGGKTVPRSLRHFPIHDAAHVRNAMARAPQSPLGPKAMPKIMAAAKKFGIDTDAGASAAPATDIERRYTAVPVELRANTDKRAIGGYASVFNRASSNLGGFVEQVLPTFFNKSRGDGWPEVLCRYNHDDNMLLGTTEGGTLRLQIDNTGLLYECDPPGARQDIVELVSRGDVRKSSFAFRCHEDEWSLTDQGFPQRSLHSGRLIDVAPVNIPAYVDSSAGLRSLAYHFQADLEEVRELAQAEELRKFFVRTDRPEFRPKKTISGALALMTLQERRDPWEDVEA